MIQQDKEYQTESGLPVKLAHIEGSTVYGYVETCEGWVPRSWDTASGKVGGLVDRKWCLVEKKATKEIDFWLIIERDGRYWITPDPKYDDGVGFARIHIKQTVVEGQTE